MRGRRIGLTEALLGNQRCAVDLETVTPSVAALPIAVPSASRICTSSVYCPGAMSLAEMSTVPAKPAGMGRIVCSRNASPARFRSTATQAACAGKSPMPFESMSTLITFGAA